MALTISSASHSCVALCGWPCAHPWCPGRTHAGLGAATRKYCLGGGGGPRVCRCPQGEGGGQSCLHPVVGWWPLPLPPHHPENALPLPSETARTSRFPFLASVSPLVSSAGQARRSVRPTRCFWPALGGQPQGTLWFSQNSGRERGLGRHLLTTPVPSQGLHRTDEHWRWAPCMPGCGHRSCLTQHMLSAQLATALHLLSTYMCEHSANSMCCRC